MTHSASSYMFLSRPRRFGKSLLTSTLHSYFSGHKDLFHGLAMEKLEKEWTEYPVLHFDMSTAKHADSEQLLQELNLKLYGYEQIYGRLDEEVNPNQRLMGLIKRAYEQTGKKVVVLIDEYDAPLLDVVHERENLDVLRNIIHFTYPSPDIYNPFSLLTAMEKGKIGSYWFGSGTPTYLIKMLDKFGVKPSEIGRKQLKSSAFDAPTETMTDAVPLLYQSGYITIKDYNKMLDLYTLDIPNKEVRLGLMESLLPHYVDNKTPEATTMVAYLFYDIQNGDMDAALHRLQEFLSTIPYCDNTRFEGHYQQVFYIIFSLLGYYVDVEVRTPRGRVDIVLRTKTTLYLMELKLDKSAGEAMEQIDLKNYPERFALCGLPVVKVAVSFDSERCTIGDWKIINA